jgi:hypothetical protein
MPIRLIAETTDGKQVGETPCNIRLGQRFEVCESANSVRHDADCLKTRASR